MKYSGNITKSITQAYLNEGIISVGTGFCFGKILKGEVQLYEITHVLALLVLKYTYGWAEQTYMGEFVSNIR